MFQNLQLLMRVNLVDCTTMKSIRTLDTLYHSCTWCQKTQLICVLFCYIVSLSFLLITFTLLKPKLQKAVIKYLKYM